MLLTNSAEVRKRNSVSCPTDPNFAVGTRESLVKRNEFNAVDDPSQAGAGHLLGRFTVVLTTTPLTGGVSIGALVCPGIVPVPYLVRHSILDHPQLYPGIAALRTRLGAAAA